MAIARKCAIFKGQSLCRFGELSRRILVLQWSRSRNSRGRWTLRWNQFGESLRCSRVWASSIRFASKPLTTLGMVGFARVRTLRYKNRILGSNPEGQGTDMHESCRAEAARMLGSIIEMFRDVSCETRLELMSLLTNGPSGVGVLADSLELGVTVISGHLAKLAKHGIVLREAIGRTRRYRLAPQVRFGCVDRTIRFGVDIDPRTGFDLRFPAEMTERLGWDIIEFPPASTSVSSRTVVLPHPVVLENSRIGELKFNPTRLLREDGCASYPPLE